MSSPREVWQRGPIRGVPPELMPVAHALEQAREDLEEITADVTPEQLWARPAGAAALGFHLQHVAGSVDRLFTYARGERLNDEQKRRLADESDPGTPPPTRDTLVARLKEVVLASIEHLRTTPVDSLLEPRTLGRAEIPTNVIGLLFHAAEHAQRHVGAAVVTGKIVTPAS